MSLALTASKTMACKKKGGSVNYWPGGSVKAAVVNSLLPQKRSTTPVTAPTPDPDVMVSLHDVSRWVESPIDEAFSHNVECIRRRISAREHRVIEKITQQHKNSPVYHPQPTTVDLTTPQPRPKQTTANKVATPHVCARNCAQVPCTQLCELRCLQRWSTHDLQMEILMRRIESEPAGFVLDPSWCESQDCPYSRGSLECQRYVLLKRLYQVQCAITNRRP